jgi:hypothetical protein
MVRRFLGYRSACRKRKREFGHPEQNRPRYYTRILVGCRRQTLASYSSSPGIGMDRTKSSHTDTSHPSRRRSTRAAKCCRVHAVFFCDFDFKSRIGFAQRSALDFMGSTGPSSFSSPNFFLECSFELIQGHHSMSLDAPFQLWPMVLL